MFQFHEGPIKTVGGVGPSARGLQCFNSMKVRLKQSYKLGELQNSLFQFHEGPIKTRRERTTEELAASFNSMKVRLKPCRNLMTKVYEVVSIP